MNSPVYAQEQVSISRDDVRKAAGQLKCRKVCGYDGIFNEHLKNGGSILSTWKIMYNHGHIPEGLKKGIIITLHKSKSYPNNYRALIVCRLYFLRGLLMAFFVNARHPG